MIHREGFWYSSREPTLPMPVANVAPVDTAFLDKLAAIIPFCDTIDMCGSSTCRLCGADNESAEFYISDGRIIYAFPAGIFHYYTAHQVHPQPEFRAFIMELDVSARKMETWASKITRLETGQYKIEPNMYTPSFEENFMGLVDGMKHMRYTY